MRRIVSNYYLQIENHSMTIKPNLKSSIFKIPIINIRDNFEIYEAQNHAIAKIKTVKKSLIPRYFLLDIESIRCRSLLQRT